MTAFGGLLFSHGLKDKLVRIANEKISGWQNLYIALQGGLKEYLYATDELIKLKDLVDAGIITPEELIAKKEKILRL